MPIPLEHYRVRRQTVYADLTPGNPGATATLGASRTLFEQNGHRVDGQAQVSRNYRPNGPTSVSGGLNYQGPRGDASITANHVNRGGTDVGVTGNANLWRSQDGRSSLDANANYNKHFGGQSGNGRSNYGVGAVLTHRFGK